MNIERYHIIREKNNKDLRLRTIGKADIELLREWKNLNRNRFFYQEVISKEMQEQWYLTYLEKDNGEMFVVEEMIDRGTNIIGCMGYRYLDDGSIDLYNIIRGAKSINRQTMTYSMHVMLSFLKKKNTAIMCKVLQDNPHKTWYINAGFTQVQDCGSYVVLVPDFTQISTIDIVEEEKEK